MAKKAENIFIPTDKQGQILQSTDETGLTADNVDIFEASDGTFYREIGSKTIHTTIAKIRAMSGANENIIYKTMDFGIPGEWMVDSSDTTTADDTGSCLVTADGVRLKKKRPLWINVADFGCIPNGKVIYNQSDPSPKPSKGDGPDQSANLAAAIEYANSVGSTQINSSTGSPAYFLSPTLVIPPGLYNIKNPIPKLSHTVSILGYGATLKADQNWDQDNILFDYVAGTNGIWYMHIEGFRIDGFEKALNIYNNNAAGKFVIRNIDFIGAKSFAVNLSCRSSTVAFENCLFGSSYINVDTCNKVTFDKCRFDPGMEKETDNYIVTVKNNDPTYSSSACELTMNNCFCVPKANPDYFNSAWIYNYANGSIITIYNCRMGGEGTGGLPIIINEGGGVASFGHQTALSIIETEIATQIKDTPADTYAAILLKDVPNLISIKNCTGFSAANAIRWHPDVVGQDVVDAIAGSYMVSINVDNYSIIGANPALAGTAYQDYIRKFIPIELRPFLSHNLNLLSQKLSGTEIDFRFSEKNIYQSISADTTYTVSNEIDGKELNILFTNSDSSAHTITITGATFGDGTSAFIVPASSSVMVKLISINSVLIGWVNIAPSATPTRPTKHISADYTVTNDDEIILVDTVTAGADINVTLPTSPVEGQVVRIVNFYGAGTGHNAVVKDGSTTIISLAFEAFAQWVYHDSNWRGMDQGTLT